MTGSQAIDDAIRTAETDGNVLAEESSGWTDRRHVVFMRHKMGPTTRLTLAQDVRLRGWVSARTPHNRGEEGFTDDTVGISISFPSTGDTALASS